MVRARMKCSANPTSGERDPTNAGDVDQLPRPPHPPGEPRSAHHAGQSAASQCTSQRKTRRPRLRFVPSCGHGRHRASARGVPRKAAARRRETESARGLRPSSASCRARAGRWTQTTAGARMPSPRAARLPRSVPGPPSARRRRLPPARPTMVPHYETGQTGHTQSESTRQTHESAQPEGKAVGGWTDAPVARAGFSLWGDGSGFHARDGAGFGCLDFADCS